MILWAIGADLCRGCLISHLSVAFLSVDTMSVTYFFPLLHLFSFVMMSLRAEQMFYFSVLLMLLYAYSL